MLGIELRVSHRLGKYSTPEPYPQPQSQGSLLTASQKKRKLEEAKTQKSSPLKLVTTAHIQSVLAPEVETVLWYTDTHTHHMGQ